MVAICPMTIEDPSSHKPKVSYELFLNFLSNIDENNEYTVEEIQEVYNDIYENHEKIKEELEELK